MICRLMLRGAAYEVMLSSWEDKRSQDSSYVKKTEHSPTDWHLQGDGGVLNS